MNYEHMPTSPEPFAIVRRRQDYHEVGIFREVQNMAIVEIWFPIEGFPNYQWSDRRRVRNAKTKRIIKPCLNSGGYPYVQLYRNNKGYNKVMHRLVAEGLPNPEGKPCVNHKNGIKTDYLPQNLEWVTVKENSEHAHRTGLTNEDGLEILWKQRRQQTHCTRAGHLLDGLGSNGKRFCKVCSREYCARWRARNGR